MNEKLGKFSYSNTGGSIVYSKKYRQHVQDWMKDQRHTDHHAMHRQCIRDNNLGCLDTSGRAGRMAPERSDYVDAEFTTNAGNDPFKK